jgi:putative flippase GtrA
MKVDRRGAPLSEIAAALALYALVGVVNTATDWAAFFTILALTSTPPWLANVYSFVVSLVGAYVLNATYTFRIPQFTGATIVKFTAVAIIGAIGGTLVIYLTAGMMPLWGSKAIATVVSFAVTFTLNYVWAFGRSGRLQEL